MCKLLSREKLQDQSRENQLTRFTLKTWPFVLTFWSVHSKSLVSIGRATLHKIELVNAIVLSIFQYTFGNLATVTLIPFWRYNLYLQWKFVIKAEMNKHILLFAGTTFCEKFNCYIMNQHFWTSRISNPLCFVIRLKWKKNLLFSSVRNFCQYVVPI